MSEGQKPGFLQRVIGEKSLRLGEIAGVSVVVVLGLFTGTIAAILTHAVISLDVSLGFKALIFFSLIMLYSFYIFLGQIRDAQRNNTFLLQIVVEYLQSKNTDSGPHALERMRVFSLSSKKIEKWNEEARDLNRLHALSAFLVFLFWMLPQGRHILEGWARDLGVL